MTTISIVQVTCPDLESAQAITAALLDERLIACANIIAPCLSVYRWEGAIATAHEAIMQVKTLPETAATVAERVAVLHPYDLPAIEHWTAETDDAAYRWVREAVNG